MFNDIIETIIISVLLWSLLSLHGHHMMKNRDHKFDRTLFLVVSRFSVHIYNRNYFANNSQYANNIV